jgi:hypothetical protein
MLLRSAYAKDLPTNYVSTSNMQVLESLEMQPQNQGQVQDALRLYAGVSSVRASSGLLLRIVLAFLHLHHHFLPLNTNIESCNRYADMASAIHPVD